LFILNFFSSRYQLSTASRPPGQSSLALFSWEVGSGTHFNLVWEWEIPARAIPAAATPAIAQKNNKKWEVGSGKCALMIKI
tara:strand:- start:822 stop:1064 length:243 start_codon:yes stop_codon:yes gene_type:complete